MSQLGRRLALLIMCHQVLQYGQSEYVRQFGMSISDNLVNVDARIIEPPRLKYNPASRQANVVCRFSSLVIIWIYLCGRA
jgi:eukaryotic translation initiation factor 2C